MREITFRTKIYHVAGSLAELKKAKPEMWGMQMHHIFGRTGILKLLVENIIYVTPWVHGMQKSLSVDDRNTFEMYVRNVVGEVLWENLKELADYIKNQNPIYKA